MLLSVSQVLNISNQFQMLNETCNMTIIFKVHSSINERLWCSENYSALMQQGNVQWSVSLMREIRIKTIQCYLLLIFNKGFAYLDGYLEIMG